MKILRLLAPLFLLAATAFGQVVLTQAPGTYTDTSLIVRDGTYNKTKNAPTLLYTTSTNPGAPNSKLTLGANTGDTQLLLIGGSTAGNTANSFNFELHDGSDVLAQSYNLLFDLGLQRWSTTYWSTLSSGYVTSSYFDPGTNVTTFPNGITSTQFTSSVATGTAPLVVASTTLVANLHAATADSSTTTGAATNIGITNDTSTNSTMFPLWVTANTGNLPAKVTSTKLTFNPSTGNLASTSFNAVPLTAAGSSTSFLNAAGTYTTPAGTGAGISGTPSSGQAAEWVSSSAIQGVAVTGTGSYMKGTLPTTSGLVFSGVASPTYAAGKLLYDTDNDSLTFYNSDSNIGLQIGQEFWIRVRNDTGSTIANGAAVYISGAASGYPQIALANANSGTTAAVAGLATESIATNTVGFITTKGIVHDIDTSAFSAGARVYLATSNGALTATPPTNPNYQVVVGTVVVSNASTGSISVDPSAGRIAGTLAYLDVNQTFTGVQAFSPTARSSGVAPYFTVSAPADTGITAATEGIGVSFPTATRTWATTGTVALQRERFFAGPTYASASASQTFTDAFNSYFTPPVAGTNAIFTRNHTLGIVDSTSAASSITGGLIVATTLGTTATSVGIGGGNVNAGGLITGGTITSTGTFTASGTSTHTGAATFNNAVTINGAAGTTALTLTNTARTSGVLPYIKYTIPTDTGQTAATESPGIQGVTGTRTWATTGTVALQREIFFPGPTYASASASQTFTDVFNMYLTPPVAGTNAIFTRGHTLGIVDSTSAASSITGGLVVATTLGTSATSVGIGGGNINAGGTITGGGAFSIGTSNSATVGTIELGAASDTTLARSAAGVMTVEGNQVFAANTKTDVLQAAMFAADAGATDAYAITLSPAATAYVTGVDYWFKANTANTGAATLNVNSLGAKTIVKLQGAITTTLADNDIRAGQWVHVVYDGTNMQMMSQLGNSPSASITGTDTQVMFFDGANNPSGDAGMTYNKTTDSLTLAGTLTTGSGASTAGAIALTQGTTQSTGTTNVTIQAPTAVTSYIVTTPGTVGTNGAFWTQTTSGSTATLANSKAVPTGTVLGDTDTQTLTNKRVTARITSITSSATPTVNTDNCDCVTITALAAAITSMTTNLSGTPVNFDQLEYRILDNGTARSITWGASFASGGATLPTTTTVNKALCVYFEYDSVQAKWMCQSTFSYP